MASNTKGQSRRSGFSNCFIHSNAASSLPLSNKKKVNHWLENRYVSFPLWVWKAWKTLRDVRKQNLKLKITVYVFVDNSVCRFLLGCSVTLIKTSTMVGREARDMKHKQNGTVKCTNVHLIKHRVRQYDRSPSCCSIITCDSFFTALFEKKKNQIYFHNVTWTL